MVLIKDLSSFVSVIISMSILPLTKCESSSNLFLVEFMLIWAIIILLTFFERIFFNSFILWRTDWSLADLLLGYSKDLVLPKYTVNSSLTDSRQFKLFKYLRKFDTKILSNFLLRCSLLWFKWKSGLILWCLIIGSPIVLHIFDRYSFTNTTFSFRVSFLLFQILLLLCLCL